MPTLSAIEYKTIPFELKGTSSDGHGTFEGVGGAFHNIDHVKDIIAKGAFAGTIADFLSDGFIGGQDHNWQSPIGHPYEAKEVDGGLYVKAVFDNTPDGQATRAKMAVNPISGRATIKKLSIGYKTLESKNLNEQEVKSYWQDAGYTPSPADLERSKGGVRLLTKLKLFEVSPVLQPANDLASIHGVKSAASAGFAEHSRLVATISRESLEAFKQYVERCERRTEARVKEGRVLSTATRSEIADVNAQHRALCESHIGLCDRVDALLARTGPKDDPDAMGEDYTTGKSGAASTLDHDSINQRFIATMQLFANLAGG